MSATQTHRGRRKGVIVPMITPVTESFELDEKSVRRVIDHLIAGGVDGIFVVGTTGESASLPMAMRSRLVELAVQHAAGRAEVYAGISGNCLTESLRAGREYLQAGADALVAHLPFYFALSDDEQLGYFQALLGGIPGPLVVYNIPPTTHMSIPVEVVAKLAGHPNAVALKDSSREEGRIAQLVERLGGHKDFAIFSGYTAKAAEHLRAGADGYVPSTGNLAARLSRRLYDAALAGRKDELDRCQAQMDAIGRAYQAGRTLGGSLAALKALMAEAGLCGPTVLPPLRTLDAHQRKQVVEGLVKEGLSVAELVK